MLPFDLRLQAQARMLELHDDGARHGRVRSVWRPDDRPLGRRAAGALGAALGRLGQRLRGALPELVGDGGRSDA